MLGEKRCGDVAWGAPNLAHTPGWFPFRKIICFTCMNSFPLNQCRASCPPLGSRQMAIFGSTVHHHPFLGSLIMSRSRAHRRAWPDSPWTSTNPSSVMFIHFDFIPYALQGSGIETLAPSLPSSKHPPPGAPSKMKFRKYFCSFLASTGYSCWREWRVQVEIVELILPMRGWWN